MSILVFIIFALLVLICVILSGLFYYHIQRYAYIGDVSKRVFLVYAMVTSVVILLVFLGLIINHIL